MFGDKSTSSSDSSAIDGPSHNPSSDPECFVVGTFFFLRALCLGEWSLSAILSLFWPQEAEVNRRSQTAITCEGGAPTAPLSCNQGLALVKLEP